MPGGLISISFSSRHPLCLSFLLIFRQRNGVCPKRDACYSSSKERPWKTALGLRSFSSFLVYAHWTNNTHDSLQWSFQLHRIHFQTVLLPCLPPRLTSKIHTFSSFRIESQKGNGEEKENNIKRMSPMRHASIFSRINFWCRLTLL